MELTSYLFLETCVILLERTRRCLKNGNMTKGEKLCCQMKPDKALAIRNALRYIHPDHHAEMAREFAQELNEHGRASAARH